LISELIEYNKFFTSLGILPHKKISENNMHLYIKPIGILVASNCFKYFNKLILRVISLNKILIILINF